MNQMNVNRSLAAAAYVPKGHKSSVRNSILGGVKNAYF